jgi:hypothetical protein
MSKMAVRNSTTRAVPSWFGAGLVLVPATNAGLTRVECTRESPALSLARARTEDDDYAGLDRLDSAELDED